MELKPEGCGGEKEKKIPIRDGVRDKMATILGGLWAEIRGKTLL